MAFCKYLQVKNARNAEYQSLVARLVEARQGVGLSQRGLSALLDKPYTFVQKVESLERQINPVELMDYLAALGVEVVPFIESLHREIAQIRKRRVGEEN